ncbi:MarR family winged helix-turn-helix transcriptional regulator [Cellulomonas sp. URHD0024]|uniref:MarR family winged helix-turn-helix transcriptional regulator n=1 Tax=Cellulomonas sp. URHD0024 TaxID=1302620 RepID=UPI0004808561|nr:MarR family winged helix-turn-helix transcriptional regulator [Cellulomonas sp. URHD0024]
MPIHDQQSRTPARVKDRPTWLISRAFARSSGLLAAAFESSGSGLRSYHYRILAALDEWGPASQADLGRGTGIDRSDVTAAVSELESRGFVARSADPEHGRRNIVSLLPAGAEQLLALDDVIDAVQEQVLRPLSPAQRRQLVALLLKLLPDQGGPTNG